MIITLLAIAGAAFLLAWIWTNIIIKEDEHE